MSGLIIAMSVLGAVGVVAGASLYLSNTGADKNPYDLSDQYGNTRTGFYNQWNPTPQVNAPYHPTYNRGGSTRRKRNKKNTTRRHKKSTRNKK